MSRRCSQHSDAEVIDFLKSHTYIETRDQLGMSEMQISRICKRNGYSKSGKEITIITASPLDISFNAVIEECMPKGSHEAKNNLMKALRFAEEQYRSAFGDPPNGSDNWIMFNVGEWAEENHKPPCCKSWREWLITANKIEALLRDSTVYQKGLNDCMFLCDSIILMKCCFIRETTEVNFFMDDSYRTALDGNDIYHLLSKGGKIIKLLGMTPEVQDEFKKDPELFHVFKKWIGGT